MKALFLHRITFCNGRRNDKSGAHSVSPEITMYEDGNFDVRFPLFLFQF